MGATDNIIVMWSGVGFVLVCRGIELGFIVGATWIVVIVICFIRPVIILFFGRLMAVIKRVSDIITRQIIIFVWKFVAIIICRVIIILHTFVIIITWIVNVVVQWSFSTITWGVIIVVQGSYLLDYSSSLGCFLFYDWLLFVWQCESSSSSSTWYCASSLSLIYLELFFSLFLLELSSWNGSLLPLSSFQTFLFDSLTE